MVANYKEKITAVKSWVRAKKVTIHNEYQSVPTITFTEEEVTDLGNQIQRRELGEITQDFSSPSGTFEIVDPVTGAPIRTATYEEAYVLLSSLYLDLATMRDAQTV